MKTYLIDTNILIRLIVNDVPSQIETARKILKDIDEEKIHGLVSVLSLDEFIVVVTKFYKKPIEEVIMYLVKILSIKGLDVCEIDKNEIIQVLKNSLEYKIDFTDSYLLHVGKKKGYKISTFDKKLLSLA